MVQLLPGSAFNSVNEARKNGTNVAEKEITSASLLRWLAIDLTSPLVVFVAELTFYYLGEYAFLCYTEKHCFYKYVRYVPQWANNIN